VTSRLAVGHQPVDGADQVPPAPDFLAIAWFILMVSSALSVFSAKRTRGVPSVKTALGRHGIHPG